MNANPKFLAATAHVDEAAVQPLPAALVHKQMILSTIAMLLLGMLLAWLNPGRKAL